MSSGSIRIGQLISPFGPGSIYTDRHGIPCVVGGLDHWFPPVQGRGANFDLGEFILYEPRLSQLLGVDQFRRPPDFRQVIRHRTAPTNAMLSVPVLRFPRWYRNSLTGKLNRFNLHTERIPFKAGEGHWRPVRFVAACLGGHLCDFPWKAWAGCTCENDQGLKLVDGGGADLSSVVVRCIECGKGRSLSGTTGRATTDSQSGFEKAGISCPGERPWLGQDAGEPCGESLVAALINQTNLYFGNILSSIHLPEGQGEADDIRIVCTALSDPASGCSSAALLWRMGEKETAKVVVVQALAERGQPAEPDVVFRALEMVYGGHPIQSPGAAEPAEPESRVARARREEFNVLRCAFHDTASPYLRVVETTVTERLAPWFSRVMLVEKLRETRAFYGFTRIEGRPGDLTTMPEGAMRQLFRTPPQTPGDRWLPAIAVHGEGIYLELAEDALSKWQDEFADIIAKRLDEEFVRRLYDVPMLLPSSIPNDRSWASRYLLVHSLAHIIINQLVFECGYSTASLRERLFVSADPVAPMAGMLIYTAAGDSEGTLGGLVRQGQPELLEPMIRRALTRAWWCSADPICSEALGGRGSKRANLAGCHACILLPETSCETINHGLDRAMVVGTPKDRSFGFLHELINDFHVLG